MREILFKAKTKDGKRWVCGYYFAKPILEKHFIICDEAQWEIDAETLSQYTGLTDRYGNKIWENDIVYIPYALLEDTYCKVVFKYGQFIGELVDGTEDGIFNRKAEVIGNIFDNAELLKEGAE